MARSRLLTPKTDLVSDGGTVLFSFVRGEAIEYPMTLGFLQSVFVRPNNYTFEAVVVEAANVLGQDEYPGTAREGGEQKTLFVRLPVYLGTWDAQTAYNKEEVVLYSGTYYKLGAKVAYTSSVPPDEDANWSVTQANKIYVQFPTSLGSTWTVKPTPATPCYGFFELRVTEPDDSVFSRTMKPVRGMIELLFSPTEETPDIPAQTT